MRLLEALVRVRREFERQLDEHKIRAAEMRLDDPEGYALMQIDMGTYANVLCAIAMLVSNEKVRKGTDA